MTCIMRVSPPPKMTYPMEANPVVGEGHFDDGSNKPSGAATPIDGPESAPKGRKKGISKKAKTIKQRLAVADGSAA